jgi:glycogen debranching enzyme
VDEVIRIRDRFYILATSSLAEETSRVLKHADTFLLTDRHGDIRPLGFEDHGLFHEDTRFLSRLVLRLDGKSPLLLSSEVREDNDFLSVDLTNPDFDSSGGRVHRGTVHLNRLLFLWKGCLHERISIINYGLVPVELPMSLEFDADFVDIFEVRGTERERRGERLEHVAKGESVALAYRGLDGIVRRTRMDFSPKPNAMGPGSAAFSVRLDPHREAAIYLRASCEVEHEPVSDKAFEQAYNEVRSAYQSRCDSVCTVETSNEQFNDWLTRSRADIFMMLTQTEHGPYPYAGIPWFNTVFGRDGIITALETLWPYPEISRGVLGYLAARQSTLLLPEQEAEPGKIIHEERKGEMAALKEVPFGSYYGTVDATPLFVVLAGHYYERTGDEAFIRQLWSNIERALEWMDTYGDADGDGFVEYVSHFEGGLTNVGWKDSDDSVFHSDGTLAKPPIALCEVQGYVYEAKTKAARMASVLGEKERGERLNEEAEALRKRFHDAFWCEELGTYAIALDGNKQPCRVRTSNAGHCLCSGIASDVHAKRMSEDLLSESFFSGWGIRTLASSEARYNPMAYHNGSVWPHDSALVALGLSRYGFKDEAMRILTGLFDASIFLEGEGPTLYPVACDPQAWASGAVFLLLKACLGLSIRANEKRVCFDHPALPPFLQEVTIRNLKVGTASIDLHLGRHDDDVTIHVMRREGDIEVEITK